MLGFHAFPNRSGANKQQYFYTHRFEQLQLGPHLNDKYRARRFERLESSPNLFKTKISMKKRV